MPEKASPVVLIVEDELIVAAYLQLFLESRGFSVPEPIATGEQAVLSARLNQPDVILMDINLAGKMNGIQAAEEIARERSVPFVFLSAHAGFYHELKIKDCVVTTMNKPFDETSLSELLQRLTSGVA